MTRLPLWLSWERICPQCGIPGFDPWVGKIPWRRERLPTPVFWPGELHGLYSPWSQRLRHDWPTLTFTSLSQEKWQTCKQKSWVTYLSHCSVQFSHSVVSSSLRPHGLQHARPPCPSPTPRVYSDSCPLSRWCHPAISSSVDPFSSCLQSFPASGSFPMSQFFASGGQSIGVSASALVLPMNIQDWFPLGWTGWISLQSKGLSSLCQHHSSKTSILRHSAFFIVQLSHPYMTLGKTTALTRWTFVGKVMSLLFNMLSRLVFVTTYKS